MRTFQPGSIVKDGVTLRRVQFIDCNYCSEPIEDGKEYYEVTYRKSGDEETFYRDGVVTCPDCYPALLKDCFFEMGYARERPTEVTVSRRVFTPEMLVVVGANLELKEKKEKAIT